MDQAAQKKARPLNHKLRLECAPWDAIDTEYAARIPGDDPTAYADTFARQVARGEAQAWRIWHDGKRVGLAITKIEGEAGKEMVICAMYSNAEYPMIGPVGLHLQNEARKLGCVSMRLHTCRHALAQYCAQEDGWRLAEIIMRKNLAPQTAPETETT